MSVKNVNCNCIANANGKCEVENCRGEIGRLRKNSEKDSKKAAEIYNISADSFADYFSNDFDDE